MPVKVRYSDELYHYGIEGMKWGIRRYQNQDGSYTQEGLERYGRLGKNASKSVVKQFNKELRDKHDALENSADITNRSYNRLIKNFNAFRKNPTDDNAKKKYGLQKKIMYII